MDLLKGNNFVIAGKLEQFNSHKDLKLKIESLGGRVSASITNQTSVLISNDKNPLSKKNKMAQELSIPVMTEEEFVQTINYS